MQEEKNKNKAVLVVNDNDANRFVLVSMLEQMGFAPEEAASATEALERIKEKDYVFILMDYRMPEMNGTQLIEEIPMVIRGRQRPVIFGVSAITDQAVVDEFLHTGAAAVLKRPVRQEKLEELLLQYRLLEPSFEEESLQKEDKLSQQDMGEILSVVTGLDFYKGLDLVMGKTENYMKVLAMSVKNITENCHAIEKALQEGKPEKTNLYFHSIKGICLNIGADGFAQSSKELELLARQGQYMEVSSKSVQYLSDLASFTMELSSACDAYEKMIDVPIEAEKIATSEFAEKLQELRGHIEDFEYIEITDLLEKMLGSVTGKQREGLKKIAEAVQEFEYDRALEILDAIQKEN